MLKKATGYIFLAAAALVTVWTVGGLATIVENNLTYGHNPFRLANTNVPLMVMTFIGLAILILVGRFLFDMSRRWLKVYGGFLACMGLFILLVNTAFPISQRIDIRAFLSVQAYTTWIGLAFATIGGVLFLSIKKPEGR